MKNTTTRPVTAKEWATFKEMEVWDAFQGRLITFRKETHQGTENVKAELMTIPGTVVEKTRYSLRISWEIENFPWQEVVLFRHLTLRSISY